MKLKGKDSDFSQKCSASSTPELPLSEDNGMKTKAGSGSSLSDSCKSPAVWMSALP